MIVSSPSDRRMSSIASPNEGFLDLRLLYHYLDKLCFTLSIQDAIVHTWATDVPQLAFGGDNEFLVHSMLAVSAAHIGIKEPLNTDLIRQGQVHYGRPYRC
jgi:hypothetical protein